MFRYTVSEVPLDHDAPRSLYLQLADTLAGRIGDGTYGPGDRIPSVRKLRDQFGVSLTTVLEACRVLEDRGRRAGPGASTPRWP